MLLFMTDPAGAGHRGRDRPATIIDVARLAEVSTATVSRVATGTGRVREATRRRVERAMAATGWSADPAARMLARGSGDTVVLAIAVADPLDFARDPYYARVVAGASEEAARQGLRVSVHVTGLGSLADVTPLHASRRDAGTILVNAGAREAERMADLGRPVVSMGAAAPAVPSVDPENEAGAAAAVEHLLALGRRRIAMIAGPDWNACSRERLAGYRSALGRAGLGETILPETMVRADFTRPGAERATRRLLATCPDIDAIFVASDLMATAVLQVLLASGRRVPDDVAVVGFDDSPPALMTIPALSTVRQPVEQLAALAVRTLLDPAGSHPPDQRLPTRLIVRASSAA
jgi:DNA-binding LacI/PurR family transcriptional regulator